MTEPANNQMTRAELAAKVDATILKPEALSAEVHRVATEAMQHGCRAVVAAPVWTNRLAKMVQGSGVRVVSTVSFPFGTSKSTVKAIEATSTIKDGADEIEVVAHVPPILALDVEAARAELMEIVRAARSTRKDVVIRVLCEFEMIMELPPERHEPTVEAACRAIRESGCDGVITGSGYHPAGTVSPDALALLKKYAEGLTIKAAIVDDLESAQGVLAAGAGIVGSEAATQLLESLK